MHSSGRRQQQKEEENEEDIINAESALNGPEVPAKIRQKSSGLVDDTDIVL